MEGLEGSEFDLNKVVKFLGMLFSESDDFNITLDKNVLIIKITSNLGKVITKANVPVNVKNNDILGWYCDEVNLCLLPIRDNKFMLRNGCGKNKTIRSLHTVF